MRYKDLSTKVDMVLNYESLYLDFGIKGMKKGIHKAIQKIGNFGRRIKNAFNAGKQQAQEKRIGVTPGTTPPNIGIFKNPNQNTKLPSLPPVFSRTSHNQNNIVKNAPNAAANTAHALSSLSNTRSALNNKNFVWDI